MPTPPSPLKLDRLTKYYGAHRGVEELTLAAEPGEILGFLGPNGSGKTTTIRVLMGLLPPTSGRAWVAGLDVQRQGVEVRRRVGYLPGDVALYKERTGEELLKFALRIRRVRQAPRALEVARALDATMDRTIKTLSRGMRQKVALVLTLAHDPELLLLDEPTSGLDPLAQRTVLELLRQERERGKTVFFSSHALWEAEDICERVVILREGRLVALESIEKLRERKHKVVTVAYTGAPPNVDELEDAEVLWRRDSRMAFRVRGDVNRLLACLQNYDLRDLTIQEPSLEEVFLDYYRKAGT